MLRVFRPSFEVVKEGRISEKNQTHILPDVSTPCMSREGIMDLSDLKVRLRQSNLILNLYCEARVRM